MLRVAVRTAVVADAPFIARVHVRSWQVGYRGIMPDEVLDAISLEQREGRWRQILSGEEEPGFTVVADVDGRGVQGFGSGVSKTRDDDAGERTGEVTALYVEPSRWRCGLGRQLLAEVLDRLQRKGCQEATVWVLAENHGARRFYASVGFAPDGAEGRHDTSGQTKVRLAASLAEPATRPAPPSVRPAAKPCRARAQEPYGTLAGVYEWLVPEPFLRPEGCVAAFGQVVEGLDPAARVLDCAAGIGHLAVGLRLRGFDVVASDASRAMVDRTRKLVSDRGVDLPTAVCRWEQLAAQGWSTSFDAVFCVGNSLAHAPGQVARRAALGQMAGVLRAGGLLVVTSRNWELVRSRGSGLSIGERLVERDGVRGLVAHGWTLADGWEDLHCLDVAVALVDATGGVTNHAERLTFWPFRHGTLDEDLRAAGLSPASSTYAPEKERYLVTARRGTSAAS